MKLYTYEKEKRFCSRTGKELKPKAVKREGKFICDYSGEIFDIEENYDYKPAYTVSISYCHDSEPAWDQDNIDELMTLLGHNPEDFDDVYGIKGYFFEGDYHFLPNQMYGCDNLGPLMKEWVDAIAAKKSKSIFRNARNFAEVLRLSRLRTIIKLLKEKKIEPIELGLTN